ncbi:DMT family transporter [Sphingomonas sp. CJ99]
MPPATLALMLVINLFWAGNIIISKYIVATLGVPPFWAAGIRGFIIAVALSPWLFPLPRPFGRILFIALAMSGGSFGLSMVGLMTAAPSAVAIVSLLGAPLTVLLAILMLDEQVGWRRGVGIALAFGGVVTALAEPQTMRASTGLLFVLAGAVVGALGSVMMKRVEVGAVKLQAWAGVSTGIGLMLASIVFERDQAAAGAAAGWPFWAAIATSALLVSVVAHTAYFWVLRRHDANLVAPLTLLTPVFAVMMGAWITNDPVSAQMVVGGLIAMAGVAVILVRPSKRLWKGWFVREG